MDVLRAVGNAVLLMSSVCAAAQGTFADRPPMGWNSWNHFAGKVTDADVRAAADALVSTGMRDAGYVYVNVDDTWQGTRDAEGVIHANERFPDMKALGDYIHAKGLKFGIYSSPGAKTCGGYAGSLGHEAQDAKTYAGWGVDFLKYDLCSFQDEMNTAMREHPNEPRLEWQMMQAAYAKMGAALKATGRPIVYSLCQYGLDEPWKFGPGVGAQMWRTTDDINDTYPRMIEIGYEQAAIAHYAGPGHWNDPDMLEVGNGGMKTHEYQVHMALWTMLNAPLLAGNDLSRMRAEDKAILTNREAIAIDQDTSGPVERLWQRGDLGLWKKPLSGGRFAVALVNNSWGDRDVPFSMQEIGFATGANVHDIWAGKDEGRWRGAQSLRIGGHSVKFWVMKP